MPDRPTSTHNEPPPAPLARSPWLDKLSRVTRTEGRRRVARNAFFLYLIQASDYVIPLITVPYLVRALGPERYGTVGFGAGVMALVALLVDYGFVLTATRQVSVERGDSAAVSRTAASVWGAKALVAGVVLALLAALTRFVPRLGEIAAVLFLQCGRVVGGIVSSQWLFQGMERMSVLSAINLAGSLVVTACIFLFIHDPADYLILAGLQGGAALLAGAVAVGVAVRLFRLQPPVPRPRDILQKLRGGFAVFFSTTCASLYTTANSAILGLLTNDATVGFYVAAEKLVGAVRSLMSPISQAIYPRLSRLAAESKTRALHWSRYLVLVSGGLGAALCLGLWIGAPLATRILFGEHFAPSVAVIRILAPLAFLVGLSNVFGIQIMLPFGRDRAFSRILLGAGAINVGLALLLAPRWQAPGMAAAVLTAELFVTASMGIYLLSHNLNPFAGSGAGTPSGAPPAAPPSAAPPLGAHDGAPRH
jgi:PST family polysaccharide transporter